MKAEVLKRLLKKARAADAKTHKRPKPGPCSIHEFQLLSKGDNPVAQRCVRCGFTEWFR